MNTRKRLKKDFDHMEIPSKETVLPHTKTAVPTPTVHRTVKKRWLTAPMAVAMAMLLVIGVAAAGGIILSQINARILTGNYAQLTEVPEGYVGIYTVEDLVKLNESLKSYDPLPSSHYILMNDLTFTEEDYAKGGICEGGWSGAVAHMSSFWHMQIYEPDVNDWEDQICFINGNGHVIRNLKIHVDANEYLAPEVNRNGQTRPHSALFVGLFTNLGRRYLQIINLGIEGCEINIRGNDIPIANHFTNNQDEALYQVCVGAIAATAEYLGGCYVNGLTLNLDLDNCYPTNPIGERYDQSIEDRHIYGIGSAVGYAQYVDACYAENVEMNISVDSEPFSELYVGGIAGHAVTCLTSWSSCEINASGSGFSGIVTDEIVPEIQSAMIPQIIPEEAFNELKTRLAAKYGEQSFEYQKLLAYFVRKDLSPAAGDTQSNNNRFFFERWNRILNKFSGKEDVNYDVLYLFDPTTTPKTTSDIVDQIVAAFESEEAYRRFCAERNIMLGQLYCYRYGAEQTVTEANAAGFDFETLWVIRDGRPRLRIFEN
jgi:hypothetical protein